MQHSLDDTIAAIATPQGPGGVGIVRISGPQARQILARLVPSIKRAKISSHKMFQGWLVDPGSRKRIDQIMACFMNGPRTYTGEDVTELYCHGSRAVLQKALDLSLRQGARLAQNGEFTKRAFLNKKLDLAQAEAVLDLVSASTSEGAGYAVRQLEGRLSALIKDLRQKLIANQAELEAQIDFPDDIAPLDRKAFSRKISAISAKISNLLATAEAGRIFRQGWAVAIIGRPNVGKSSLMNALLGEDRAIVTNRPGTTRDTIEEAANLNGMPVRLIDTAGLRKPRDVVEKIGVDRADKEMAAADILLVVIDGAQKLAQQDIKVIHKVKHKRVVFILNKADLPTAVKPKELRKLIGRQPVYLTSALYGSGIGQLKKGLARAVAQKGAGGHDPLVLINSRHRDCLIRANEALARTTASLRSKAPIDCITIDLKSAIMALGEISGELVSEEIINQIFEQFCVGK
ncbi:MAG: tRNA uridine-5-carboxymethylaminomethyl(34) synthesis GTPase MnmE [Candidatus Saganbacteria bacterium]|nr:tRNA uridine-5-carboxymethylaminomethyl(34) synthesis GTPase MnmE [Candidatus Saganbacteria bacterium]